MGLSVSLPDEDVAVLDEYARTSGLPSRSAVVRRAIRMLRLPALEQDYAAAWEARLGHDCARRDGRCVAVRFV